MLSSPGSQAGPEEAINANMRYVVSTICIADKAHGQTWRAARRDTWHAREFFQKLGPTVKIR
jgi:hypothetical protein